MGSWWQSQLNFAEGLLDQVDKKVTSAVGANEDQPGGVSSADREGSNSYASRTAQPLASSGQGARRASPVSQQAQPRARASPSSLRLPSKKVRPTATSTTSASNTDTQRPAAETPKQSPKSPLPVHPATTGGLHKKHGRTPGSPAAEASGWTAPANLRTSPKSSPTTPTGVLFKDDSSSWQAQPHSPMAKVSPAQRPDSATAKPAITKSRFAAIPPPPPPILPSRVTPPTSTPPPPAQTLVPEPPLPPAAPALSSPPDSPSKQQTAFGTPPADQAATDTQAPASPQGDSHDATAAEPPVAEASSPQTQGEGVQGTSAPDTGAAGQAPDAELRAAWWSEAAQPQAPPSADATAGEDQDVGRATPAEQWTADGTPSPGSGDGSAALNGGHASTAAASNGAEAGGVLTSGTSTTEPSSELLQEAAPTGPPAAATPDPAAMQRLRDELTTAQGRAAVAESGLAEARDNAAAAEARADAAEARADAAAGAAAEAKGALADAQERTKAAVDSAAAARSKAREAMERAGLKADQLRSCEARLGQVEAEAEAAVASRTAAEAEVARLKAQASQAAAAAAQEGHEYVDTLQRELTAAREAAEAAVRDAAAERAAAAEARIAAARRQEQLEASLGSAHAEAANCARAAEEAGEALEVAEGRVVALERRIADAESGRAAAAAPDAGRIMELEAALEAAEARCAAAQRAASDSRTQVVALEQDVLERANSGAHIAIQELQQQLHQANHLLVERQGQWEHSSAERGARILTLERQLAHVETQLAAAQRQAEAESSARGHSLMMADEVVPLASLGGYHRFASSRRFGSAVKAFGGTVDRVTAQAVALLRRHPAARLLVLLYITTVHAFIYLLLGRMQHAHLQAAGGMPTHSASLRGNGVL